MRSMRKLLKSLRSTSTGLLSREASIRRRLPIRSFERVGVGLRRSSRGRIFEMDRSAGSSLPAIHVS